MIYLLTYLLTYLITYKHDLTICIAALDISAYGSYVRSYLRFLSRVSILTRDIDIANLSVCLSVRPSVTFQYQMKTA